MSLPLGYLDLPGADDVEAIRVACDGEVESGNEPKLKPHFVSPFDLIFHPLAKSQISELIELPIVARKIDYVGPDFGHSLSNSEATSLFTNCEPTEADSKLWPIRRFGLPPEEWQLDIGPIMIARQDQKPLHVLHAAALLAFCHQHLTSKFIEYSVSAKTWIMNDQNDTSLMHDRQARQRVLDSISKKAFESFFYSYKARRVAGVHESADDLDEAFQTWDVPIDERLPKPEWADVCSPYEV